MRLAQDEADLILRRGDFVGRERTRQDLWNPQTSGKSSMDRGVGSENDVVLVRTFRSLPLLAQHSDDLEGDVTKTDLLPHGIHAREERVGDGLADERHLTLGANVLLTEEDTGVRLPIADLRVIHRDAADEGSPIAHAADRLGSRDDDGRDAGQENAFA